MSSIRIVILNNEIYLDEPCWNCSKGTIKVEDHNDPVFYDDMGRCEQCNDTGYILTDAGRAIVELVNRHGGKKL